MAKPKHTPSFATSRPAEKEIRTAAVQPLAYPSWRFSTVDKAGPFAWPSNPDVEKQILQKLGNFDSMFWREIVGSENHSISIHDLSKEAKKRLMDIKQDDVYEVFSFRCNGRQRIIGIRDNGVVKLLWWDPNHQVCISDKKHT